MEKDEIETKLPKSFEKLQAYIAKILKSDEDEEEKKASEAMEQEKYKAFCKVLDNTPKSIKNLSQHLPVFSYIGLITGLPPTSSLLKATYQCMSYAAPYNHDLYHIACLRGTWLTSCRVLVRCDDVSQTISFQRIAT